MKDFNKMQVLLKDDFGVTFIIEFTNDNFESDAQFKVYKVESVTKQNIITDAFLYLKGNIKWDGCANICFGDGCNYLHICGKLELDDLKQVIDCIWHVCSKKIDNWDDILSH